MAASYMENVNQMFDVLNNAQLAHLDARPANIMWKATSDNEVEIQLIDFEDVFMFGETLNDSYADMLRHDSRYPLFLREDGIADSVSKKYNEFYRIAISRWIKSDLTNFFEFVVRNMESCQRAALEGC